MVGRLRGAQNDSIPIVDAFPRTHPPTKCRTVSCVLGRHLWERYSSV